MAPVPGVHIGAEDVRRSPFRAAVTPLPSLTFALRDTVGARRGGTPEAWCEAIRRHLRPRDYETLAPFATPRQTLVPDQLLGLVEPPGESLEDGIERMIATPSELLAEEIADCTAASGSRAWREAERDPGRWLRLYVACLLRAWKGFGPLWRLARPSLDREVERVGVATALDAQLELLDGLLADGAVEDGRWCVSCSFDEGRFHFPDDGLVLMPMIAGARSSIVASTDDTLASVSYPVRSGLALEPTEPPRAALEALLGIPRAQILRALSGPTMIGRLAETLQAVPSAATHHVGALEAAGLVERDRRGRNVLVRRTARGEALLELYEELDGARTRGRPARTLRAIPGSRAGGS
jgi:DNA-binding transcriptional ArsR family regulator